MKTLQRKIAVPEGVSVDINGHTLSVSKGSKKLSKDFGTDEVVIQKQGNEIILSAAKNNRQHNAILNALATHVQNLLDGSQGEFEYKMSVVFSHFPMTVALKGNKIEINNFTGEKRPRTAIIIGNTKVEIKGKDVVVRGSNKEETGQTAANIENATRIVGKDRRIYQDGIYVVGKKFVKA